jgi:immune inhibitor A
MGNKILRTLSTVAVIACVFLVTLMLAMPVGANPPAPDDEGTPAKVLPNDAEPGRVAGPKNIDRPNTLDYWRIRERQRLLDAGLTAEAAALAKTGNDRVLVILVEFGGPDVFTWEPGDTWDPLNQANAAEVVYDEDGYAIVEDCSGMITAAQTFTYAGPLHNEIPRPVSEDDPSGDTIWTEDFSPEWFDGFMFGAGVTFNYTRTDGSLVNEDFTGESIKNYMEDMSQGQYTINGDVIGWLKVPHSTMWYGADLCPGARSYGSSSLADGYLPGAGSPRSLVKDALDAVNAISDTIPGFDWANYDLDGDGVIDRLWIVHAGYGEEDSATLLNRTPYGEGAVWSHSSAVTPPYQVSPTISAGPYIIMPENGGIGVFAHEYGHNLGADDLYTYSQGETSAGFWTIQADDWTGYPIGFEPPSWDPWHLDNWGWLEPKVITDPHQVYTVKIGQTSDYPDEEGMYRGVKIELPTGVVPLAVQPVGAYQWWGGKNNLINAMMTAKNPIAIPGGAGSTLNFSAAYDTEEEWDFLWVQGSADGGETWRTLVNANTVCEHDPSWIGELYGFPADMCAAGIGGLTGYNAAFPDYETQVFSLNYFRGKSVLLRFWYMTDWGTTYSGPFIDNVVVKDPSGAVLFSDDAESGDANWTYADGWERNDGTQSFSQNYYLQWRNVNDNGGYDSALGDSRWRFGPANTGLLVWYNNNYYTDAEIFNYLFDYFGFGPKGRMLVVDSHPEPYRDPYLVALGYGNEAGNVEPRMQMRDAPFTLQPTVGFTVRAPYVISDAVPFAGRPAVKVFDDAKGYYPGAEYVSRGPGYDPSVAMGWVTKQWDASVVLPGKSFYGIKAPGYEGSMPFRFGGTPILSGPNAGLMSAYRLASGLGYDGGTGDPGDSSANYGWRVQLIEEAADHTWGVVRISCQPNSVRVPLLRNAPR